MSKCLSIIFKVIFLSLLFTIFCIFFMIIGFVDFIKFIFLILFQKSGKKIKSSDDAEFVIRNFAIKNSWNQNCNKLISVYNEDEETIRIINIARNKFDFLNFESNIKNRLKKI